MKDLIGQTLRSLHLETWGPMFPKAGSGTCERLIFKMQRERERDRYPWYVAYEEPWNDPDAARIVEVAGFEACVGKRLRDVSSQVRQGPERAQEAVLFTFEGAVAKVVLSFVPRYARDHELIPLGEVGSPGPRAIVLAQTPTLPSAFCPAGVSTRSRGLEARRRTTPRTGIGRRWRRCMEHDDCVENRALALACAESRS